MAKVTSFAIRLQELLDYSGITKSELSRRTGISKPNISNYIKGAYEAKQDGVYAIAQAMNVNEAWLMGYDVPMEKSVDVSVLPDNILPLPITKKVPLLGDIACGVPILAEENISGYVDVPDFVHADFCLRCKGDSMINARINDGDYVFIRKQPTVEHGQIAAVLIDSEATLKRVYLYKDYMTLQPENPAYEPRSFFGEQMNDVRILGLAVAFLSDLN